VHRSVFNGIDIEPRPAGPVLELIDALFAVEASIIEYYLSVVTKQAWRITFAKFAIQLLLA
jgi:hypothetical protein